MLILKRILNFYINSSIHVALAVCSLSCIVMLQFDLRLDKWLLLFTFFASICGYNFVKYFGVAKLHYRGLSGELQSILWFSVVCFLAMLCLVWMLSLKTILIMLVLAFITFFYAIPFMPKRMIVQSGNLRGISGLKIYIIAFVWAMVTVLLPMVNAGYDIDFNVVVTLIQRFLYVLVAMLPFEIRDMQYDSLKLSTIPQRIGVKNTKIIGVLLLIPFFFLEFLKDTLYAHNIIVLLVVTLLLMLALVFSSTSRSRYYTWFWVEAIPIAWLGLTLLLLI